MNITEQLDSIGPKTILQYLAREGDIWWAELRLPDEGYTVSIVTAAGADADEALQNTIDRALKFAKGDGGIVKVNIRCGHCGLVGVADSRIGVDGHDFPEGWAEREVVDPMDGTDLVRKYVVTLCPECAGAE